MQEDKTHCQMRLASTPGYPGGQIPVLTLIVEVTQGLEISTSAWSQARDELQAVFDLNGFDHVRIEMYDWDRAFLPSLFPLMPDHDAIGMYETKRAQLLDCVRKELGRSWKTMSLFGFGRIFSSAEPALMIVVNPGVVQN